ncbi:MAG: hypothetical protein K940chlam2_01011 [Chlamydiae bacterium]|nr:hypothetical protein [Chlamydiota bacterium]
MAVNKKCHEDFQQLQQDWKEVCANPNPTNLKKFEQVLQKFQNDISETVL